MLLNVLGGKKTEVGKSEVRRLNKAERPKFNAWMCLNLRWQKKDRSREVGGPRTKRKD